MIPAIASSLSGMRAAFKMLDVSASNTANMNTDGYKRKKVELSEGMDSGVVVNINTDNGPGRKYRGPDGEMVESSNTDYVEEVASQITAKHYLKANAAAFKTADDMQGILLDTFA